ncbi:hypothetical protein AB8A21_02315 [Streptomyces sp. BF23-18]|uniref:hypothetical protein n=1 Tax=Streptomyces sp. BF23-18 TaxID=3240282 RepID=UPI0034E3A9C4
MAVHEQPRRSSGFDLPTLRGNRTTSASGPAVSAVTGTSTARAYALALLAGVALRIAAVAGTAMMTLMWVAEWPPARHLADGSPSMSANPFVDYHVIYAVTLIALAVVAAGDALGLGRRWAKLPIVRDHGWLR